MICLTFLVSATDKQSEAEDEKSDNHSRSSHMFHVIISFYARDISRQNFSPLRIVGCRRKINLALICYRGKEQ